MKILLTNDDGIFSEGIYAMFRALKDIGEVVVVAPDREKSSISHSITLTHPLWASSAERNGRFFGTALSGTPADCVKYGLQFLCDQKPDLVVAGINPGPNDGCSVFYSGTVAGAREGAMNEIPSVAISVNAFHNIDYQVAADYGMQVVARMLESPLPAGSFLNVNIPRLPAQEIQGIRMTRQGTVPIATEFSQHQNPYGMPYYWMSGQLPHPGEDPQVDVHALQHHYVTVTPLQCDQTDHAVFQQNLLGF